MKEYGTVTAVHGKKADVVIARSAMCGECGACQIGKEHLTMQTTAENNANAHAGQQVAVEMEFTSVMKATAIAYGIPLVMMLVGGAIGWLAAPGLGLDQVLTSFWTGVVFIAAAYLLIHLFEKKGMFNSKYKPVITEIMPDNFIPEKACEKK
ncbi:MAG: SoxR reducing system RseC family protein [Eubacteriaceae bacterium]|jgi:sigma-E factor negative regulatory protein RseC